VGSARLTCGQNPSQTPSAQVSPKREDLSRRFYIREHPSAAINGLYLR